MFLSLEKMQKSVAEKRKDIENQRRLAREKLQMKQLIKAKRAASNVIRQKSPDTPTTSSSTPSTPTTISSTAKGISYFFSWNCYLAQ